MQDIRGDIIFYSKYSHTKENGNRETRADVFDRVIGHQKWLWERAIGRHLNETEVLELIELKQGMLRGEQMPAGRTLNLGGLPISREVEASQFNCWNFEPKTVRDLVDVLLLLLYGCGVSSKMLRGLSGFQHPLELDIIRTERTGKGGLEHNTEGYDDSQKVWRIGFGDSAEGWAKAIGKILAHPYPAKKLIVDFSELRPQGLKLSRFKWISNGDSELSKAVELIVGILNQKAGYLLSLVDIKDIIMIFGGTLATRRAAFMPLMDSFDTEIDDFITAKSPENIKLFPYRQNGNYTIIFHEKPSMNYIKELLDYGLSHDAPAFMNMQCALKRYEGTVAQNPCGEALVSPCNLWELNATAFGRDMAGFLRAAYLAGRANYRQTQVDLTGGTLQEHFHRANQVTRSCGVSLTHCVGSGLREADLRKIASWVDAGIFTMSQETGTQFSTGTRVIQPSGTKTKAMFGGGGEGIHNPLAKYLFNNINFRSDDPIIETLKKANYTIKNHPTTQGTVLVSFPVHNDMGSFREKNGLFLDSETALQQLERYKKYFLHWTNQNVSMTLLYRANEINDIVNWLDRNWDEAYISIAFMKRYDDYGDSEMYGYFPQQPVTERVYQEYVTELRDIDIEKLYSPSIDVIDCAGGSCPAN
jgi:adenosylcobalamin-dependent ribonucleoside-triphosphate reductase